MAAQEVHVKMAVMEDVILHVQVVQAVQVLVLEDAVLVLHVVELVKVVPVVLHVVAVLIVLHAVELVKAALIVLHVLLVQVVQVVLHVLLVEAVQIVRVNVLDVLEHVRVLVLLAQQAADLIVVELV